MRVCGCAEKLSDKVTRNLPPLPLHAINRHGVRVLLYDSAMKGQDEGIRISDNRSDACWVHCSVFTLRSLRLSLSLSSSHRVRACTQRDMQLDRLKDMNMRTTTLTQRCARTHRHTDLQTNTHTHKRTHAHTHTQTETHMHAHERAPTCACSETSIHACVVLKMHARKQHDKQLDSEVHSVFSFVSRQLIHG